MSGLTSFFSPNSLRGQLLLWLLGPLFLFGLLAIYDSYRTARETADSVSDRVLAGSALAIAERVFVNDNNDLEVDIPYVALQMLTSSADDRVFYRIENANGSFITGYRGLKLPSQNPLVGDVIFQNSSFRDLPVRIATYSGAASSNTKSLEFRVAVAETTNARTAISQSILIRSLLRQAALLLGAALLVWFAITRALRPLQTVERAVNRRSADDVRPIEHRVPTEVTGLVQTINELVSRFASSITALQNFTSNASHQFRTPLALIKTHLEIASRDEDEQRQKEAIANAHNAVNDAERLMSQLLLMTRLDSVSKKEIRSETCDLTSLVRDVCEEFILQLSNSDNRNIDLGFEGNASVCVFAERTLAQEVVRNLIDNAIKHAGKASKIDVRVFEQDACGVISVGDDGEGFDVEKVFLPFNSSRQSAGKLHRNGTGIGLSIVQEIIDLMDGEIVAEKSSSPAGMKVSVRFRAIGFPS